MVKKLSLNFKQNTYFKYILRLIIAINIRINIELLILAIHNSKTIKVFFEIKLQKV